MLEIKDESILVKCALFCLLTLVTCILYVKVELSRTVIEGHTFKYAGMVEQEANGQKFFIPVYQERK